MKKLLLCGLLTIALTTPKALAAGDDSCDGKIQNNIIIHGIGGSKKSFGFMDRSLEKNIPCTKSHHFEYNTKSSQLSTVDFAKSLDSFLNNIPVTKEKDLNFIMHSQGGLVGLTYLFNTYNKTEGFSAENLKRLNKFVSMSTPFWGSDFAMMGQSVFFNFNIDNNGISPFGKNQLNDMKYGSQFFQGQIRNLFHPKNRGFLNYLKSEIKVLNISGMAPFQNSFLSGIGSQFFEGDFIVNIPSMTLNTLNAMAGSLNYKEDLVQVLKTHKSELGKQSYVIGTHIDVYAGTIGYGVVDTPEECLELSACDHPGFNSLFSFLTKDVVLTDKEITKVIKGFDLHVMVGFPKGITKLSEAQIVVKNQEDKEINLSNYRFNGNEHKNISLDLDKGIGYFLIKGSLISKLPSNSIELEIRHPEITTRRVVVEVEKGKATILRMIVRKK
ncbi:hypothetical protein A9Q84_15500 [Halobacteriovorax marinus]|uniref:DUF676 domain-containing protein n=1 Tax=Halobacteriovorax marinus TaxID=97084 RepID=A0A1Y5F3V3_9BACT|nr:hypothetical protein A9Q84_15500 [Halobacteriovorax marinus]